MISKKIGMVKKAQVKLKNLYDISIPKFKGKGNNTLKLRNEKIRNNIRKVNII